MKTRFPVIAAALIAAASLALAAEPAPLPDMSQALQSRIDGRISASLDGHSRSRPVAPEEPRAVSRGADRTATTSASGRTDESGWKPYHSAM